MSDGDNNATRHKSISCSCGVLVFHPDFDIIGLTDASSNSVWKTSSTTVNVGVTVERLV